MTSAAASGSAEIHAARGFVVRGRVQGVGYRPFVHNLARRLGLRGYVRNISGDVEISAEGPASALTEFERALFAEAPSLARPTSLSRCNAHPRQFADFAILPSRTSNRAHVMAPPDLFMCDACRDEIDDSDNRRFNYPFVNCTQCGPRYTIIAAMPYDRANTTLRGFEMCPSCASEYANPADRRFHAEPIACPECGPRLALRSPGRRELEREAALDQAIALLRSGAIVAVKGVGGYHLMCDATSSDAVLRLRVRKKRPAKPFAVLFADEAGAELLHSTVDLDSAAEAALRAPARPIVLARSRKCSSLAPQVAPGCCDTGVMLAYSPLHHLLLKGVGRPLVATSANISGEPVLTEAGDVEGGLGAVADAFLHHDRPIARPADDSVVRVIAGRVRTLRVGRGFAPLEFCLPFRLKRPLIALGGQTKATICLGWGDRVVMSPHVGDLETARGLDLARAIAADLARLHAVEPQAVVCDAHPDYASTRLARTMGLPVHRVFHHRAHAAALTAEFGLSGDTLVFTWDGCGYGEDGALWGGEALFGRPGAWRRVASMRRFPLPGGERAAREPWRSALALCREAGVDWKDCPVDADVPLRALAAGLNCPGTSAVGRLFDAAAALLGLSTRASFEGEAPMALESLCEQQIRGVPLPLAREADGVLRSDWRPLVAQMLDATIPRERRAGLFHASMARALVDQARALRLEFDFNHVGLTGGVFQNRILCETVSEMAKGERFEIVMPERAPCNDGGLSFGQIVEAGAAL